MKNKILKVIMSSYTWFALYTISVVPAFFLSPPSEAKWILISMIWATNSLISSILTERAEAKLKEYQESGKYFTIEDVQSAFRDGRLEEKLKNKN